MPKQKVEQSTPPHKSTQLNKPLNSQRGAIDLILIIVIVVLAAGLGGYVYYRQHQAQQTYDAAGSGATVTKHVNPYAGWKTYTLKYEKFSFKYPPDMVLTDKSDNNTDAVPGTDWVILKRPNGLIVEFQTGLSGLGGGCFHCKVVSTQQITFLGKPQLLNIRTDEDGNIDFAILAATKEDTFGAAITGKNTKLKDDGSPLPMAASAYYLDSTGTLVTKTLTQFKDSQDMKDAIKIFESAEYK